MPKSKCGTHRCDPALFKKDLSSQVIVVTGANSGIGFETTKQLAKQGATVIMGCRSKERGEKAAKEAGGVFIPLDLSSLGSVREFVKALEEKYDRLDALVNNAGVMAAPYSKTEDGFEFQMATNHFGHFLLMTSLAPLLLKTAEATGKPSRFVALSSAAATQMPGWMGGGLANVDFDDLNWEKREYDKMAAYQQSKLCNLLHAMEAAKRHPADKLICVSAHPGWVQSNLDNHLMKPGIAKKMIQKITMMGGQMIPTFDGAQSSLHCVLEDADKMENGAFYAQKGMFKDKAANKGGWPLKPIPNENATPEAATKLWEVSEKLVGA